MHGTLERQNKILRKHSVNICLEYINILLSDRNQICFSARQRVVNVILLTSEVYVSMPIKMHNFVQKRSNVQ